jgi:phenylacetate-coenzyme A ligase PaaK-like adenylate-forming protein
MQGVGPSQGREANGGRDARSVFVDRAADLARALTLRWGRLRRAEQGSRAELLDTQRRRLDEFLDFTWQRSPFYRRRWGERPPRAEDLPRLEPLTKAELSEHYDEILTERSLSRAALQGLLGKPRQGPYVVLATSGTTGEPMVVPYGPREWAEALALALRGERRRSGGLLATLRHSRRLASVMTHNPIHASTQLNAGFSVPPLKTLHLAASLSLEEQMRELERFRPTTLTGYPSAIDPLARAQLEGRLSIRPRRVIVGGESCPEALRSRVRAAWGAELFDCYGLTETLLIAHECRAHGGLHLDEDAVVVEVVDEDDRPLPPGRPGAAILITNLYNRTLPIIRYRVGDVVRIDDAPCPCGAPFARLAGIAGRREEMLRVRGRAGGTVEVQPLVVETPLEAVPGLRRFQIREAGGILRIAIERDRRAELPLERLEIELRRALEGQGADPQALTIEDVESIEDDRGRTDKRRRVVRG